MSDYGHIQRLASFHDIRYSKVPEAAPSDKEVVNEILAFDLLQLLPQRMKASHLVIETVMDWNAPSEFGRHFATSCCVSPIVLLPVQWKK